MFYSFLKKKNNSKRPRIEQRTEQEYLFSVWCETRLGDIVSTLEWHRGDIKHRWKKFCCGGTAKGEGGKRAREGPEIEFGVFYIRRRRFIAGNRLVRRSFTQELSIRTSIVKGAKARAKKTTRETFRRDFPPPLLSLSFAVEFFFLYVVVFLYPRTVFPLSRRKRISTVVLHRGAAKLRIAGRGGGREDDGRGMWLAVRRGLNCAEIRSRACNSRTNSRELISSPGNTSHSTIFPGCPANDDYKRSPRDDIRNSLFATQSDILCSPFHGYRFHILSRARAVGTPTNARKNLHVSTRRRRWWFNKAERFWRATKTTA